MSVFDSIHDAQMLVDSIRRRQLRGTPADLMALAVAVFGSERAALAWFWAPAMGLDGVRPFELLNSELGVDLVRTFLVRLEHGVYT